MIFRTALSSLILTFLLLFPVHAHELPEGTINPLAKILDHDQAVKIGQKIGVGTIEAVSPGPSTPLVAAEYEEFRFRYKVGSCSIQKGGHIRVAMRHIFHWSPPQSRTPTKAGFTSIEGPPNAKLKLVPWTERDDNWDHFLETFPWQHTLEVRVEAGSLTPGDIITIVYGDRSQGGPGARIQPFQEKAYAFRAYTLCDRQKRSLPSGEEATYKIVGRALHHLTAVTQSEITPSETVRLTVRAEDEYGNLTQNYRGDVSVSIENGPELKTLSFTAETAGLLTTELPAPNSKKPVRYKVESGAHSALSNPLRIIDEGKADRIFWGDLHGHTLTSDGRGTIDDFYRYCRDVAALDVCAVTDHGFMISDTAWTLSKQSTETFNKSGSFVTIQAYEWSGMTDVGGDHNIFFKSSDPPIYRSRSYYDYRNQQTYHGPEPQINFIEDLYSKLLSQYDEGDSLAIPHYGGRKGNPAWHNPRVERLIEIFSEHQRSHGWAYDFLRKGYRLGIIASTDNHTGRPGYGFFANPLTATKGFEVGTALVAIKSSQLERNTIFDSLYSRRTYATSGDRIILDFGMSGDDRSLAVMGEELSASQTPTIKIGVVGTASIDRIKIYRDVEVVKELQFGGSEVQLDWVDPSPKPVGETAAYWVQVLQTNGEEAISSPIWWTRNN